MRKYLPVIIGMVPTLLIGQYTFSSNFPLWLSVTMSVVVMSVVAGLAEWLLPSADRTPGPEQRRSVRLVAVTEQRSAKGEHRRRKNLEVPGDQQRAALRPGLGQGRDRRSRQVETPSRGSGHDR